MTSSFVIDPRVTHVKGEDGKGYEIPGVNRKLRWLIVVRIIRHEEGQRDEHARDGLNDHSGHVIQSRFDQVLFFYLFIIKCSVQPMNLKFFCVVLSTLR